jgi:hypothetical protein
LNSKPAVKRSYLAFVFSLFLVLCACLQNYDHVVLAYMPSLSKSMPRQTVPITNFVVGNDPEHFTYVNPAYGIKMQYPITSGLLQEQQEIHDLKQRTLSDFMS